MMASFLLMLPLKTLNVNGIHSSDQWSELWNEIPKCDIITLQETYLVQAQEYTFSLHTPGYD